MHDQLTLTADSMAHIVPLLRVLADRTRLRILGLLRGRELNVTSLCEVLDLAQPTVSHHLGLLREVGLVRNRREGKQVFYALNPTTVELIGEHGELALKSGPVVVQLLAGERTHADDDADANDVQATRSAVDPPVVNRSATDPASVAAADVLSS